MSSLAAVQSDLPSEAVINEIADREDVQPTELTPLYHTIDPDALDALVENAQQNDSTLEIGFTYHGYSVTVTDEGLEHVTSEKPSERPEQPIC